MELLHKYLKQVDFDSYEDFNENFSIIEPEKFNFAFDVVDYWADKEPEKTALVYVDDFGNKKTFTFLDIKKLSCQAANYFLSKGIGKSDVVLLTLKHAHHYWYLSVGLHRIGAICVPATEQLKSKDFEYRFYSANVKMAICIGLEDHLDDIELAISNIGRDVAKAYVGGFPSREGWDNIDLALAAMSDVYEKPDDFPCDGDLMLMYFTSGTSGNPKIVAHNYKYPLGHITTAYYWSACENNGLHYSVAETGWAKCAWSKIYGQWLCGCAVLVHDMESFNPQNLLGMMESQPITSFCAPPTIFRFLIREDLDGRDFNHIKHMTTAGEPLNAEVYNIWHKKTGIKIREGFGQSESVIIAGTFKWMEPKPGSLGKPNALYNIKMVDENGKFAATGDVGQISIMLDGGKIPIGLFQEYYQDAERTYDTFATGVYYTGDLAVMDEQGFLWFEGRSDDVIKTSGYRVGPFEVESALMRHPAVMECAITGVPDEIRGQVLKASIVLNKGFAPSDELKVEIQNFVKAITAPYKYPRVIEFLEELPKTFNGKIKRFVLRNK
ncbi:MAG: AMP-binding protein [Eubacteriaceae bacterium]|nr:AMP-binding protein [Eubacteriaceae bacterium]